MTLVTPPVKSAGPKPRIRRREGVKCAIIVVPFLVMEMISGAALSVSCYLSGAIRMGTCASLNLSLSCVASDCS